jgi:hypothetical protein
MPNRPYPPAYLRYLRARLWNLARPSFWITAIFLAVMGLVIREYWLNPELFTQQQNNDLLSTNSAVTEDDEAIVADIDNLEVLLNDAKIARLAVTPKATPQQKPNQGLFADIIKPKPKDAKPNPSLSSLNQGTASKRQNLFVTQAENLLQMGTGYSTNQVLGVKSAITPVEQTASQLRIGLPNQTENNQNAVVVSPLQAAINQSTNQNSSYFNRVTSSQINTIQGTAYGSGTPTPPINNLSNQTLPATNGYIQPTVTNLPANSLTNFNNPPVLPSVSPVTPAVTSGVINNFNPYSPQNPNQNAIAPITPENYSNPSVQQPTPVTEPTPRPRPIPGPYGGIDINGYRYP